MSHVGRAAYGIYIAEHTVGHDECESPMPRHFVRYAWLSQGCLIAEVSAPGVSVTVSSVFIGAVATGKRQGVDPL